MSTFNSYTVYDKEGNLIANGRSPGCGKSSPADFFNGLPSEVQHCADVMLVLQENGFVARYRVQQPTVPAPTLGEREEFRRAKARS